MKEDVHTETLMRAVLDRKNGLRTNAHLSHVFHMTVPDSDEVLCITDAVINILPTLDQKLDIAKKTIKLLHALENPNPKVAILSSTEVETEAMQFSLDAAKISMLASKGALSGATIDGPLAFDLAVSPEATRINGLDSPVAGNAEVLLVPNIETGNALFEQMVCFMSATAAGIVLGAQVPIMLTSRADPAVACLASAALVAIFIQSLVDRIETIKPVAICVFQSNRGISMVVCVPDGCS